MKINNTLICCFAIAFALTANSQDNWIPLFDGKSLTGWKASENQESFKVEDGSIVCSGNRSHLFYIGKDGQASFRNFEFSADVLTKPGANSGIYILTRFQEDGWPTNGFEIQINNTYQGDANYKELKKTGSLYGIRNIYKQLVNDNEWFNVKIKVQDNNITVWVNDIKVVDYSELELPDGYDVNKLNPGTFALQCHDPKSTVFYRNLKVKPLPSSEPSTVSKRIKADEIDAEIIRLASENFPLIDFHSHLKGGLTLEELLEHSRKTGIAYGVAANCGLGFAITNDATLLNFFASISNQPVFVAMQAEGREWTKLFSKEAISKFDYIFTDAMTFFDESGKRIRLWINDEVQIKDKQKFMDMYVERIVSILENEPIDIYANATFLPEAIASEYDKLWTEERIRRVVGAAVSHNVAIEINDRYKIPSAKFIKIAKQAGAKFSFGTNNGGKNDIGRLEYCIKMVKECNLTWKDMFMPPGKNKR